MSPSPEKSGTAPPVRNVLVVDDEPTLRLGFSYALSSKSTFVESASSGRQALEKIRSSSFDIVILDLRMPDIDGIGVIETLRLSGNLVPIVLCSAAVTPLAAFKAIQHRVPDFLQKPVRPSDLREVVDYVLNPPDTPVSRALVAARAGKIADAIREVEREAGHDRSAAAWLAVFRSIVNPPDEDSPDHEREQLLRSSLAALAFRSNTNQP
jgi:CheY-like chemotaxis protein